ncbi:MAG: hypothetical protein OdinLCB4_001010 [Candidatus Odinarchaeum yellowstonii]|uniref:Exo-alpha-sialidase n=1 Tax=Odinarchaeota yellowstonii (strain LCB_4) TaxID=1841599 RepID=A0AAF0IBM3_ODILC|nr:MAG: hypothetical protein OdinLCB4_001010 [Candidatus Odinarchaeum yellowstonii]
MNKKMKRLLIIIMLASLIIPLSAQLILVKAHPDAGDTWSTPETISLVHSDFGYFGKSLVIDEQNNVHVVYASYTDETGHWEIFYVTNKTGEWTQTQISDLGAYGYQYEPSIALDSYGLLHVMWSIYTGGGKTNIFYTNNSNNHWNPAFNVSNAINADGGGVRFAIDLDNIVHAIYLEGGNAYYINRTYTGVWSTPKPLFTPPYTITNAQVADIAVSSNGKIYLVVKASNGSEFEYLNNVYSFDGVSAPPVRVTSYIGDSSGLALTADRNDHAHLVYNYEDIIGQALIYRYYNGSAWGQDEVILNATVDGIDYIYTPSIGCDYDNNPHIAFITETDTIDLKYTNKTQGTWGTPVLVAGGDEDFDASATQIFIDRQGYAHIIFDFWPGTSEVVIRYTHTTEPVGSAWPTPPPTTGDLTLYVIIVGIATAAVIAGSVAFYMLKKR